MGSYDFSILHEKVSENDAFKDKTHEKAALNIHKVIESSQSAVTIGLEGGWGSGKSTVVNLLRKKLSQSKKKTLVYLFDAWAHDGDPLRRIFLEGLIDEMDPEAKDFHLQEIRNKISGNKKTVNIKTKKSASWLGGLLSVSAIFVPLGAALLSAIDYSTIYGFSFDRNIHWPFWSGLILTLSPLWVLISWRFLSKDNEDKRKRFFLGKKDWDVFESSGEESIIQDVTEDGERTSIEFERFFGQIMNYSIGDNKKYHRALIVIDNLDRIEPEQTLSIWSILQTFFQYRSHGDENKSAWQNKLWFLIPYDREGLSKVWQGIGRESDANSGSQDKWPDISTNIKEKDNEITADSFLEKCFQLVEEVPEPVLSSWAEYCQHCVEEALIGWPEESRAIVIDTYKRFESSLNKSPSPRQIQSFVNKVGMLGMRWGDSVSPEAIALYALIRRKRSERQLRAELLKSGLPDNYQTNNESELKAELTGILFGVDKNKGIQLLLEPEIREALGNSDSDKLSELIERHGEAFWIVWNAIRNSVLPTRNHVEDYRIAFTKAFCIGTKRYDHRISQDITHLVNEWKSKELKWELDKFDYKEPLKALVSVLKTQKEEFLDWLNKKVSEELNNCIRMFGEESFKEGTLYGIRSLMDYLEEVNNPISRMHYPSLNQTNWIAWLEKLKNLDLRFAEVLPDKNVMPEMIQSIDATNAGGALLDTIIQTLEIYNQVNFYKFMCPKLTTWLVNQNHALGMNSVYGLLVKCYLSLGEESKKQIKESLENASCVKRINQESVDNMPSLIALFAIIYDHEIFNHNIPSNINNFFQNTTNKETIGNVLSVLERNNSLGVVWELARSSKNKFALTAIRSSEDKRVYDVEDGAHYIDEYEWATEDELNGIINKLIAKNAFEEIKESYIEFPVNYAKCMAILFRHGGEYARKYIEEIIPKVKSASWKESFEAGSDLLSLISGKGNHEFKDGVWNFAQEDLTKSELNSDFWNNFKKVYEKLPDRDSVVEKIVKKYFELDADPFDDISFEAIISCISDHILSKIDPLRIMDRVELWLSTNQWARLEWLSGHDIPLPDSVNESLALRLNDSRSNFEEYAEIIEKLASIYGVKITDPETV
ncbi:KAP family NTPase [Microbulbifer thermotolerans]|uniref:P-loop NTPase fold protein n=1 Tax=Microbulbifer thermotolerans TaxID=252514 RepID=UPI0022496AC6|nr:P-loop NTPase fold protein [Microbulbifer thermotolerans]MCX2793848.1 KAP family NTPase [Microbulbifer thermotolerans]